MAIAPVVFGVREWVLTEVLDLDVKNICAASCCTFFSILTSVVYPPLLLCERLLVRFFGISSTAIGDRISRTSSLSSALRASSCRVLSSIKKESQWQESRTRFLRSPLQIPRSRRQRRMPERIPNQVNRRISIERV